MDEKIFNIEESFNRQNDKVYATSSRDAREKAPKIQRPIILRQSCLVGSEL